MFNKISVIGLGYIGLPTAAIFASRQKKVLGIDIDASIVRKINKGEIHITEPGLNSIVHSVFNEGYLKASVQVEPADVFIIAVPTPFKKNNSEIPTPDLKHIKAAVMSIAPVLTKGNLVILESTSPVGTTEKISEWLSESRPDLNFPHIHFDEADINIAYCPERVLPGNVVNELIENDRVIGGISLLCSQRSLELYKTFVNGECIITNSRTAEMVKLTENSCRDVQLAFANELSIICDNLNIDVWELISLANRHPRINILNPGPGVGGHCIAVDPWFIVSKSPSDAHIIKLARKINDSKPDWVCDKIKITIAEYLQKNESKTINDVTIAFYGLAFKADIDDLRESPAVIISKKITDTHKGRVLVVEPYINSLPKALSNADLCDFDFAQKEADVHVVLVDHNVFKEASPDCEFMIDTRGIW